MIHLRALTGLVLALAALAMWPALARADIYWANLGSGGIGRDTIDGNPANATQSLVSAATAFQPKGVAVDGRFVYWTSSGHSTIGRANIDGSNADPNFITAHVNHPEAVVVRSGYIYWSNTGSGTISRDTVDGNPANIVDLINNQTNPSGLAVDDSHVYWTNGAGAPNSTIGRANLDGAGAKSDFITGQGGPVGITVADGFLYWADLGDGGLVRDTLDGDPANITPLLSVNEPVGIAVTSTHIYWSSETGGAIGRMDLDGGDVAPEFITTGNSPFEIAIDMAPTVIAPPVISGSAVRGQTLTAANGSWNMNPTSFSHQWLRCDSAGSGCAAITGATSQSYVLTPADVGSTIRVQEVASSVLGGIGSAVLSAPTGVVQPPLVPPPPPPTARLASLSRSGPTPLLTIECDGVAGQQCSESVVGTVRERRRGRSIIGVSARDRSSQRAKPKTQTVTVTVATSSFTVPAGHSATLRMTLNAAGKRLLTRFATLPVTLSLTGSVTTTRSVAFSLPRVRVGTPKDHWFHIDSPCGDCYTMPVAVPITAVPRGARVSVSCHGSGCPFGRRSFAPHKRAFDLAVVLRTSHLEPGTVVEVAITARGRIGELLRYAIRRGRVPSRSVLCLAPGTSSPRRCS